MTGVNRAAQLRPFLAEDTTRVVDLLTSVLGPGPAGERTPAFFDWKHRQNPFGHSAGLLAERDGQIVAVRLFLRWRFELHGQPVLAVRPVDTVTHPAHRGGGLFRDLTLDLLRRLQDAGEVDLVFNTPNANSRPGYLSMGWKPVGTMPVRVSPLRPLRIVAAARARSRPASGAAVCPFEPAARVLDGRADEVADLLAEVAPRPGLHTPRSIEFCRWRYGAAPGLDYRSIVVERAGRITGLAFGRCRERFGLREFTLADLVVRDGDIVSARALLALARRSGADHVLLHPTPGTEIAAASAWAGYLPIPRRGVGLVANARTPLPADPLSPATWQVDLGDLEVF